jgi:hypothetical protein
VSGNTSPKPAEPREEKLELPPAMLEAVVSIPFRRWGQPLEAYEASALSEAVVGVLSKYLPTSTGRYAAEMQLGLVLLMIVSPRLQSHGDSTSADKEKQNPAVGGPEGIREDVESTIVGGYRPTGANTGSHV